jgi:hypothetical protein
MLKAVTNFMIFENYISHLGLPENQKPYAVCGLVQCPLAPYLSELIRMAPLSPWLEYVGPSH